MRACRASHSQVPVPLQLRKPQSSAMWPKRHSSALEHATATQRGLTASLPPPAAFATAPALPATVPPGAPPMAPVPALGATVELPPPPSFPGLEGYPSAQAAAQNTSHPAKSDFQDITSITDNSTPRCDSVNPSAANNTATTFTRRRPKARGSHHGGLTSRTVPSCGASTIAAVSGRHSTDQSQC